MALHITSSCSSCAGFSAPDSSSIAQNRGRRLENFRERPTDGEQSVRPERKRRVEGERRPERQAGAARRSSFSGVQADYRSREQAALEVKTQDGDTVSISFETLSRIRAGAYTAQADGAEASARIYRAESSVDVSVKVDGTLDEKELKEIGELLDTLVTNARSDSPGQPANTSEFEEVARISFAYKAYERIQVSGLEAQAG